MKETAPITAATITVRFFASYREALGVECVEMPLAENIATVADFKQWLIVAQGAAWAEVLNDPQLSQAVNHDIVKPSYSLQAGDELAFFPPVTGG